MKSVGIYLGYPCHDPLLLSRVLDRLVLMARAQSQPFVLSIWKHRVFANFTNEISPMCHIRTQQLDAKHWWVLVLKLSISMNNYTTYLPNLVKDFELQNFTCPCKCNKTSLAPSSILHIFGCNFCNPCVFATIPSPLSSIWYPIQPSHMMPTTMPTRAGSIPVGDRFSPKSPNMIGFDVEMKCNDVGTCLPSKPSRIHHVQSIYNTNQTTTSSQRFSKWSQDNTSLFDAKQRWRVVIASPWVCSEHINSYELRSSSTALRWVLSHPDTIGKRVTMISDSQVAVGCITKGRSSSHVLLRRLRSITAHTLAAGITTYVRWVPSAMNPADEPSRRYGRV